MDIVTLNNVYKNKKKKIKVMTICKPECEEWKGDDSHIIS